MLFNTEICKTEHRKRLGVYKDEMTTMAPDDRNTTTTTFPRKLIILNEESIKKKEKKIKNSNNITSKPKSSFLLRHYAHPSGDIKKGSTEQRRNKKWNISKLC